jgi:hypothetical protein
MAAMRKLTALLGSLPPPQASAEMMQRLRDLAGSSPLASAGRMIRAMAGVAAAILIVCTIGLTVGPRLARPASTGAIPDWEPQALAGQVAETPGSSDELVANWMVQDLSGADGHE